MSRSSSALCEISSTIPGPVDSIPRNSISRSNSSSQSSEMYCFEDLNQVLTGIYQKNVVVANEIKGQLDTMVQKEHRQRAIEYIGIDFVRQLRTPGGENSRQGFQQTWPPNQPPNLGDPPWDALMFNHSGSDRSSPGYHVSTLFIKLCRAL